MPYSLELEVRQPLKSGCRWGNLYESTYRRYWHEGKPLSWGHAVAAWKRLAYIAHTIDSWTIFSLMSHLLLVSSTPAFFPTSPHTPHTPHQMEAATCFFPLRAERPSEGLIGRFIYFHSSFCSHDAYEKFVDVSLYFLTIPT